MILNSRNIIALLLATCAILSIGINIIEYSKILAREDVSMFKFEVKRPPDDEKILNRKPYEYKHASLVVGEITAASLSSEAPSCLRDGSPCRYDDMGKYLEASALFTIIHKQSDAIPARRRIPKSQANNATYIAERRSKGPPDGSLTALVEYNPTLLPLTSDLDPKLIHHLTGRHHPGITDEEADRAKYLSVARGGNLHICGNSMRRKDNPTKEQSYLVLALLDEKLQPIPGASAAVRPFQAIMPSSCFKTWDDDPFQDFQIAAVRSTKGND